MVMLKTVILNAAKYFPFLLKTLDNSPKSVIISLTNRCNCRCLMCSYWKQPPQDELNSDEIRELIRQSGKIGIKHITFYGGEPLLREELEDYVSFAHSLGMYTKIITNGTLLNPLKINKLIDAGLNEFVISFDMCSEELDKIRGHSNYFQKVSLTLSQISKLDIKDKLNVKIASILMLPTLENQNILKVIDFADKLSIPVGIQMLDFSFR